MDMLTTENQSNTNQGTQIQFWITPTGTNTITQLMSLSSNTVTILGNANVSGNVPVIFGSFANTTAITATSASTPYTIQFTTALANTGLSYTSGNSRIGVSKADTYNIIYNMSFLGSGGSPVAYFWLRHSNIDVPGSMTTCSTAGSQQQSVNGGAIISMAVNDYVELVWAISSTNNGSLSGYAANSSGFTHPSSPSAVLTIVPVGV